MCHQYMSLAMQCNALRLTLLLFLTLQRSWWVLCSVSRWQSLVVLQEQGVVQFSLVIHDCRVLRGLCVLKCYKIVLGGVVTRWGQSSVTLLQDCSVQVLQDGGSRVWPLGGSHTPTTGRSAWQCVDTLPPQASIGFLMTFLLLRLLCRDTGTLIGFLMAWHQ